MLILDSASAELLRGADVQVVVTLTRAGGASADVTLSVTGLPANVDASFSPVVLSGGTLTSTLTLSATAAATEGDYDLSVTGTGTGLADTADLALDVVSLSVTGHVVTMYDLPVVGAAVSSQGDTGITDASGKFNLTGLAVPYDLSVWNAADEWVHVFEGLTTDEPLLAPVASPPPTGTARSALVSGNLSGGVIPVAVNQIVFVCVEGVDGVAIGCDTVGPTESSYSLTVDWLASATRQVVIHALQFEQDLDGYPVGYQGYASMALSLTDTVPTVANLNLGAALATTSVAVDIDTPSAIVATIGAVQVGPNMAIPVMLVGSAAVNHMALMPVIGDASYTFAAAGSIAVFGWQAEVTGASATVVVPALPLLIAPADLATGITTATNFTASNATGGPMTYVWSATVGDMQIAVTTMASAHSIPDLTEYGLALPAGADFLWQVLGHSGTTTEDGAAGIGDYYKFLYLISASSPGLRGDGTFAVSDGRTVTTAP